MVKVLIATKPDDADAAYVKLALERKGHDCVIWYTPDFPTRQTHSFELFQNEIVWNARGVDLFISDHDHFDTVWLRRPRKPVLTAALHPDDIENAKSETMALYKTFWRVIEPDAFWVNSIDKINSANCKLLQLKIAMESGFNVPNTLFSNDPERIREFIQRHHHQGVIYKTLHPVIWLGKEEMRLTYTDEIHLENLPSDAILQNTPGIFQNKIPKNFELRLTYFGETGIAVKIPSQTHQRGIMDWRHIPAQDLKVERFDLPADINEKCKLILKRLGLVMGCFDFIVTPDNEYYFLEVNEQGQFIWIEELNSDIKMLDVFSDFLIYGRPDFKCKQPETPVSLQDFRHAMTSMQLNAMQRHINPETFY